MDAALHLFEQNGYEQTTVEDIAAAAGISSRTFFRYFDSKTALLFDKAGDGEHDSAGLMAALVERPQAETVSEAFRAVLRHQLVEMFGSDACKLRQLRILLSQPALRLLAQDTFHEHRPDLETAFAARLGTTPDAVGPRVLAAAFTEAIWIILEKWSASGAYNEQLPAMIDEAFAAIDQGFGAQTFR